VEKCSPVDNVMDSTGMTGSETEHESGLNLTVSENGVTAHIRVTGDLPPSTSIKEVKDFLKQRSIKYGIVDDSLIDGFLKHEALQKEGFKIAEGTPAKPGTDASVKYYFDIDYLKIGGAKAGGAIDFKDRGQIPHVKKGDLLAEKTPMIKGQPGIDVYGNPIPAPGTKDMRLRCGGGAELAKDGLKVFAKTHGQPKCSFGGKISVFSEYKISGDVGLETGHIDFDGNVDVAGAIQNGFRVKGGSLKAKEILKADIEVTGDVRVSGGIIGAKIRAQGEVKAKYIENANIEVFGDVIAEKDIIGSEILASGACKALKGKIISSIITAKQGIVAQDIGTQISKPCRLKAGTEDHIEKEVKGIHNAISRRQERLEELRSREQDLEQEEGETHREIAELAQVQDRAMVEQRSLREEAEDLKKKGKKEQLVQAENRVKELDMKIKTADEAMNRLFNRQDQVLADKTDIQNGIKNMEEEIEELNAEKQAIVEYARKQKRVPVVKAIGSILADTIISGAHSSTVLEKTVQNVSVREVKITDPDSERKWEIRVTQ
jgi:uncharacterized protein (DUF342 family)